MLKSNIEIIDFKSNSAPQHFINSLKNTGFAVVMNHGISSTLIDDVYSDWSDFFSSKDKFNYMYDLEKQDGYFPMKSENAKGYSIKDLKEFYHIYLPWGRVPSHISTNVLSLRKNLKNIGVSLLKWIDEYSPDEITSLFSIPLNNMIQGSNNNLLRIIHYPPLSGKEEEGAVRAAPHEDINLITILLTGSASGLQVLDNNDKWVDVESNPGWLVVNIGDMLQECSAGYYPSTTHRVINPTSEKNHSRYSMPLFLHPRDEVILSDKYTSKSYLEERLRELGLK